MNRSLLNEAFIQLSLEMLKVASGSPAPTHSLAHRESRRNRQGYYIERRPARASIQADRQRGQSALGCTPEKPEAKFSPKTTLLGADNV